MGVTAKEMVEYFKRFPEDSEFQGAVVNTEKRKGYAIESATMLTDCEEPTMFVEIGEAHDLPEETYILPKEGKETDEA